MAHCMRSSGHRSMAQHSTAHGDVHPSHKRSSRAQQEHIIQAGCTHLKRSSLASLFLLMVSSMMPSLMALPNWGQNLVLYTSHFSRSAADSSERSSVGQQAGSVAQREVVQQRWSSAAQHKAHTRASPGNAAAQHLHGGPGVSRLSGASAMHHAASGTSHRPVSPASYRRSSPCTSSRRPPCP